MSESVAVDVEQNVAVGVERRIAPTLAYDGPLERWRRRDLWAEAAMILVIGGFTGLLLATEHHLHPRKLVVLTFTATLVWMFTMHSSAEFARSRRLGSVAGAIIGTAAGLVVLSLLNYWILDVMIRPGHLLLMGAAALVVSGVFQSASARLAKPRRVLVIGADKAALELVRDLRESRSTHFRFLGLVDNNPNSATVEGIDGTIYLARRSGDLVDIVRRQEADVIVCSREKVRTRTVDRLLDGGVTTARVVSTFDFYEWAFGRVAHDRMTKAWFTSVLDAHRSSYSAHTKRMLDVVVASAALVLLAPLAAAIGVAIACTEGRPILFRQVRSGEGGKPFTMLKFRTMVVEAEPDGPVWASDHDPRVNTIGRFLRRTRLDEIPQLWNVLRGEMSIVGPRPERPEYLDYLQREVPFWNRRLLLKPGITGWAQVHHAYTDDVRGAARKLAYDLYYLKHRSFGLDLLIVLRTFKIVLSGRGAR